MKLIELTGSPCSGKSYLSDQLVDGELITLLDSQWVSEAVGVAWLPGSLKKIASEIYLLLTGLMQLNMKRQNALLLALNKSGWSAGRKANVFRNILHKFAIHRLVAKSNENNWLLYDEGVSHLPFIFATSDSMCPKELRQYYPFGKPVVVRISAQREDIVERLKSRGHKMVKSDVEIEDFVDANQVALQIQNEDLKNHFDGKVIEVNGDEKDYIAKLKQQIKRIKL